MDDAGVSDICPGCGLPVSYEEPYVESRELIAESDVTLHMQNHNVGTRRRFHVEHFRRRVGEYVYELVGSTDGEGSRRRG